jgi:hypothetical protein
LPSHDDDDDERDRNGFSVDILGVDRITQNSHCKHGQRTIDWSKITAMNVIIMITTIMYDNNKDTLKRKAKCAL